MPKSTPLDESSAAGLPQSTKLGTHTKSTPAALPSLCIGLPSLPPLYYQADAVFPLKIPLHMSQINQLLHAFL
jgi:hypothetical protein